MFTRQLHLISLALVLGAGAALTAATVENKTARDDLLKSLDAMGTHAQVTAARIRISALESERATRVEAARRAEAVRKTLGLPGGFAPGMVSEIEAINREIVVLNRFKGERTTP